MRDNGRSYENPVTVAGFFLLSIAVFFAFYFLFGGETLEDAHITFRYARNFSTGAGLGVWNPGEPPVEGATSFLWMLILGGGMSFGVSPFLLSKTIGAASFLGIMSLYFLAWRRQHDQGEQDLPKDVPVIAAILTAFYLPFAWYAASGMETLFFAALLSFILMSGWVVRTKTARILGDSFVGGLLVLTRPEGALLAPLVSSFKCFARKDRTWINFLPIGISLAVNGAVAVFRYHYFGDVFPNTYYAKASGSIFHLFPWGARYLLKFYVYTVPLWVVVCLRMRAALKGQSLGKLETFLGGVVVLYSLYMLKVGGDPESAFPLWRHFVHIAPIWLLLAALAIHNLGETFKQRIVLALAVIIATDIAIGRECCRTHITPSVSFQTEGRMDSYFAFVNKFSNEKTTSAVSAAGQWGWYVPGTVIDILGLNDKHIAHFGHFQAHGEPDSKTDMPYVMALHPDIIDGYFSGKELNRGECPSALTGGRSDMVRGMLNSPNFASDYFFVANAPYDVHDRALFVSGRIAALLTDEDVRLVRAGDTPLFSGNCVLFGRLAETSTRGSYENFRATSQQFSPVAGSSPRGTVSTNSFGLRSLGWR